jgi:hypothetical protein
MTTRMPSGDLARCVAHEPNESWPTMIEIVAYWGEGRKGKRRSVEIPADQFFGRGGFGAPMSGEQLIGMVNRLRLQK